MKLLDTGLVQVTFDSSGALMHHHWTEDTSSMSRWEFRGLLNELTRLATRHRPALLLADQSAYNYQLADESALWFKINIVQLWKKAGLSKVGIVVADQPGSQDRQLLWDQGPFKVACFRSGTEATGWLLQTAMAAS